jgi:anti-sigma B factor antagonist
VAVLRLSGRLTANHAGERLAATAGRVAREDVRILLLDLGQVSYVDSTCLGEILEAYTTLRRDGRRLQLVNVPARVQRLLQLSHLTEVLCPRPCESAGAGLSAASA